MKGLSLHRPRCSMLDETMAELSRELREQREASKLARQQGRDVGEERQSDRQENDNETHQSHQKTRLSPHQRLLVVSDGSPDSSPISSLRCQFGYRISPPVLSVFRPPILISVSFPIGSQLPKPPTVIPKPALRTRPNQTTLASSASTQLDRLTIQIHFRL
ncbi:hypothetical protein BGW80DRAFT_390509 [Lactifluus volemus]|nr:hypothetical protein BGW80DRAFT_390509 [Lactifluus volemus]